MVADGLVNRLPRPTFEISRVVLGVKVKAVPLLLFWVGWRYIRISILLKCVWPAGGLILLYEHILILSLRDLPVYSTHLDDLALAQARKLSNKGI